MGSDDELAVYRWVCICGARQAKTHVVRSGFGDLFQLKPIADFLNRK